MSAIIYDLGVGGRLEAVPACPEGPFTVRDFRPLYTAARAQIEHLACYTATIADLRGLGAVDRDLVIAWAREFFMIDAYRAPIVWTEPARLVAIEVCFAHGSVPIQGPNFTSELARLRADRKIDARADQSP